MTSLHLQNSTKLVDRQAESPLPDLQLKLHAKPRCGLLFPLYAAMGMCMFFPELMLMA